MKLKQKILITYSKSYKMYYINIYHIFGHILLHLFQHLCYLFLFLEHNHILFFELLKILVLYILNKNQNPVVYGMGQDYLLWWME